MKKVQSYLKRVLCIVLVLCMVTGSLSGCVFWDEQEKEEVQDTSVEVEEIVLSGQNQDVILLSAGEEPKLQFETTAGVVENVSVKPIDEILEPYEYYTVTVTIAACEKETFTSSTSVVLNGKELKINRYGKNKIIVEYVALALPETITTEAMSEVVSYEEAKKVKSIGSANIQAMLDYELEIFSEDGESSYIVKAGFVPIFMVPAFVANGPIEQLEDGTKVQILSRHGEKDFEGTQGQWYKIVVDGKVGYIPVSFAKDVKITEEETTSEQTKKPQNDKTKPVPSPEIVPSEDEDNTNNKDTGNTGDSGNAGNNQDTNNGQGTGDSGNTGNSGDSSNNQNTGSGDNTDSGTQVVTYYQISFALGRGISSEDAFLPEPIMVKKDSTISLNQLATPSVPGYLFEAWFYDSALTKQVQNGDAINGSMVLYAKMKEITEDEFVAGEDNYVSSIDVDASSFVITVLKPAGARATERAEDVARLRDLSNPDVTMGVQIAKVGTLNLENVSYEKYAISFNELEDGTTYQLELLSDNYAFYYEEQLQSERVKLYNFTTKMEEVENLSLNENLIYLKMGEVSYTEDSEYLSGLFNVTVEGDDTSLNTVEGSGSFVYSGNQLIGVGATVVIYDGEEAPKLGEDGLDSSEQYDGNAAYVTISKIEGDTFYYEVAEAEEVLFTPDVLPVNTADDEDNDNSKVTIDTAKLHFSGNDYKEMGLDETTTIDVGDYIAFYSGSLVAATELTYGKITGVSVAGENTILTFETVTEDEVLESMTVYSSDEVDFELDEDTAEAIEEEMEQDAINSGFAMEAANYLATLALETDQLQELSDEMGVQSLTCTLEDGTSVNLSGISQRAGGKVKVEGLKVKANISRKLENLTSAGGKNGVRAQLEVSFNIVIGSGENKLVLKVSAIFEQEVLLNLNIKGKTIWGKKWIFPYIKDYRITTNLDVGTYTGVAITATVVTDKKPEYDWSTVDKSLSEQIHELMNQKDKFFNQDISEIGGGLAGKYADMLKNNSEWIDLVQVKIFSSEARILAGIIVVGVQADFVVSANVNIMLGMTFDYKVAKRYTFTLNVFSKTSSSDAVDLEKSQYNFEMYVMGTLGVRAGVRLTVYAGLFSKKVAAIGITAEAGAYLQLWGYFFYSNHWEEGSEKVTSVSGAMLMEIGAYLEIRFLATAFGGVFEYNPILYDKYWPLWGMGSVENVYDFNYKTTVGVADSMDIQMGASTNVALPTDRMCMSYMNLRDGETDTRNYTYSDFIITTTGNFTYENGVIKVNPQEGSAEEKGTIKLTWRGAELSFTSEPLSCEIDITWKDPSRVRNVSYELHGGTAMENGNVLPDGISNTITAVGGTITAPTVEVVKDGYIFDGWYVDAAYTTAWDFNTDKVTENLVLHAKWKPVVYEIHHMLQGLDGSTYERKEIETVNAKLGESVTIGEEQSKEYVGFTYDAELTAECSGTVTEETLVLKLYYSRDSYDVTFEFGNGKNPDVVSIKYQDKITEPVIPMKKGHKFTGWYVLTDTSRVWNFAKDVVTEDIELRAGWAAKEYNIVFDMQSGSGGDSRVMAYYDAKMTSIAVPARNGYQFLGYFDEEGIQYYKADGSSAKVWDKAELPDGEENFTLYAKWQANSYEVVFDANGGTGEMSEQRFLYDKSQALETNVFERTGYTFIGWATDSEATTAEYSDAQEVLNLTSEAQGILTLYAVWQANQYTVSFDSNKGSGSSEPTTADDIRVTYDDTYNNLPVVTREGYTFKGWYTETSGGTQIQASDKVSITANQTLYAQWTPNSYSVTYDAGEGHFENATEEALMQTYDSKYVLPETTPTRDGYTFIGWFTEDGKTQINSESEMTCAKDHTIYAQWSTTGVNNILVNVGNITLSYGGTPVYAKTDAEGNVTLGGSEEDYNIKLENGVLTLNNAIIVYAPVSNYHNGALSATGNLTIVLEEGTQSTITNTSANSGISAWNCGIYVDGNLTITGSGSLTATGGKGQSSHGISVDDGTLTINGATVRAYGEDAAGSSGIYAGGTVEIKNDAYVEAIGGQASNGESRGIECIAITITSSSGKAKGYNVAMTSSPTISGATVEGAYNGSTMTWTKE